MKVYLQVGMWLAFIAFIHIALVNGNESICLDGVSFVLVKEKVSWENAKEDCQSRFEGKLAVLADLNLDGLMKQYLKASDIAQITNVKGIWIGFNDRKKEGEFGWIDGTPWSYTNWHSRPKQPNNNHKRDECHGQDCGQLWKYPRTNPKWEWDDDYCFRKKWYICQLPTLC
ncbi:salivary C-type lectin 2-like isoform X2 [Glandiceps talaboti]